MFYSNVVRIHRDFSEIKCTKNVDIIIIRLKALQQNTL